MKTSKNRRSQRKADYEMAEKISISMPGIMLTNATVRVRVKQFPTFSQYIQDLIRADLRNNQTQTCQPCPP